MAAIVVVGSVTNFDIGRDRIERSHASDLSDLLRHEPSVSVGGSLGIAQKTYVCDLENSLLNVTIDRAPQGGTLFHHIDRKLCKM